MFKRGGKVSPVIHNGVQREQTKHALLLDVFAFKGCFCMPEWGLYMLVLVWKRDSWCFAASSVRYYQSHNIVTSVPDTGGTEKSQHPLQLPSFQKMLHKHN